MLAAKKGLGIFKGHKWRCKEVSHQSRSNNTLHITLGKGSWNSSGHYTWQPPCTQLTSKIRKNKKKGKRKKPPSFFLLFLYKLTQAAPTPRSCGDASARPHSRGLSKQTAGTTSCSLQQLGTCAGSKTGAKGQHQPSPRAKGDGRLKSQRRACTAHKQPCTMSALTSSIPSRWANSAAHNQPSTCRISGCPWWEGQTLLLPWANAWDHTEEGTSAVQSSLGWNRAVCKTSHFT